MLSFFLSLIVIIIIMIFFFSFLFCLILSVLDFFFYFQIAAYSSPHPHLLFACLFLLFFINLHCLMLQVYGFIELWNQAYLHRWSLYIVLTYFLPFTHTKSQCSLMADLENITRRRVFYQINVYPTAIYIMNFAMWKSTFGPSAYNKDLHQRHLSLSCQPTLSWSKI